MNRPSLIPAAALTLLVGLAGCSIPGTNPPSQQPSSSATASPTPGSVESQSAQEAGVDLTNLPAPIASGTMPATVDGDPNATLTVALHSLKRSGKVVTAVFSFRVTSTVQASTNLFNYLGRSVWFPYLVDVDNLNRHDTLSGGGARAMTDTVLSPKFSPGQTFFAYAMFAAPPASVTSMNVQMTSGLPTVIGVPLS